MKNKVLVIAALLLALTAGSAYAATPQYVTVNGQNVSFNFKPFVQDGVTMVQFKPVFQSLGVSIQWDQKTKTITGTKDEKIIKLTVASKTAYINGKKVALQTAPISLNGNIFVPLRFISEATGASLNIKGNTIEVTNLITSSSHSEGSNPASTVPSDQVSKPAVDSSLSTITEYLNKSYPSVKVNGVTYHLQYELLLWEGLDVLNVFIDEPDEVNTFLKSLGKDAALPYNMVKSLQAELNDHYGLSEVYTYFQWRLKDIPEYPEGLEYGPEIHENEDGTFNIQQIILLSKWDYVEGGVTFLIESNNGGKYTEVYSTEL